MLIQVYMIATCSIQKADLILKKMINFLHNAIQIIFAIRSTSALKRKKSKTDPYGPTNVNL